MKSNKTKALVGNGGHARESMAQMGVKSMIRFVDDQYFKGEKETLPLSLFDPDTYQLIVAVANSIDRFNIVKRLPKETTYFSFIHPSALLLDEDIQLSHGTFIGAGCILTTNIKLGEHCLLNRGNHIGHDCSIGNFFSSMPCAVVGGNVNIGDRVYLGSCANIRERISICDDVLIGMNSAVVKNITSSGIYVGVPSKKIKEL
jgi:sugar O-acyltransferase (sialic acid O-acetyltransferase NeuD family)